jgi:hypothetical protein
MNCCIFQDVAQMILATKALGLNLADALGAGRAGGPKTKRFRGFHDFL